MYSTKVKFSSIKEGRAEADYFDFTEEFFLYILKWSMLVWVFILACSPYTRNVTF